MNSIGHIVCERGGSNGPTIGMRKTLVRGLGSDDYKKKP